MTVLIPKKGVNNMDASDYEHFIENLCVLLESKIRGRVEIRMDIRDRVIICIHSQDNFIYNYCLNNVCEIIQYEHSLDKVTSEVLQNYREFVINQYFY